MEAITLLLEHEQLQKIDEYADSKEKSRLAAIRELIDKGFQVK